MKLMLHKYADYIQVVTVNATGGFMAWMFKLETLQKGVLLTLLVYNLIKTYKLLLSEQTSTPIPTIQEKMLHRKNIKGSPITSIAGLMLIVISAIANLFYGISYEAASVILAIGLALLFGKDPRNGGRAGVVLIVAVLLLAGCNRKVTPVSSISTHKDSVNVSTRTVLKDTSIYTPAASVASFAPLSVDNTGMVLLAPFSKRYHHATVTASVQKNQLSVTCECDSVERKLQIANTLTEVWKSTADSLKTVSVIKEKFIPGWAKFLSWSGAISLSLLLLYIIFRVLKAYFGRP